jgi:chromosomal replication initiator protein
LRLSENALSRIAATCLAKGAATPRDLQAAVLQVDAKSQLTGSRLDDGFVSATLGKSPAIDSNKIIAAVAKRFGVSPAELRSSSRHKSLVHARGVVAYLMRVLTGQSLQTVGQALGGRDHSTVHNALRKIESLLETDAAISLLVAEVKSSLLKKSARKAKPSA